MAAQPTPPQTPTSTTPIHQTPLAADEARVLLQTLLSTVPNPTQAQAIVLLHNILSTNPILTTTKACLLFNILLSPAADPAVAQVRIVLQTLLSTATKPTASRTPPNITTPNNAPTLTAAQALNLLQILLSTVPNYTAAEERDVHQTLLSAVPNITAAQEIALLHNILSPAPNPRASYVRVVLRNLLSTATNPTPPRTPPNTTTPNNALNASSTPSKNQLPSSLPTITIDASTRIIGHGNKIRLPPKNVNKGNNINEAMRAVLAKPVNLTIKTGITLSGNRNTVYFESGSDHDDGAASKVLAKACGGMETVVAERVCEEGIAGRKRRAVSEPVGEVLGKKVKVVKEF